VKWNSVSHPPQKHYPVQKKVEHPEATILPAANRAKVVAVHKDKIIEVCIIIASTMGYNCWFFKYLYLILSLKYKIQV